MSTAHRIGTTGYDYDRNAFRAEFGHFPTRQEYLAAITELAAKVTALLPEGVTFTRRGEVFTTDAVELGFDSICRLISDAVREVRA